MIDGVIKIAFFLVFWSHSEKSLVLTIKSINVNWLVDTLRTYKGGLLFRRPGYNWAMTRLTWHC
jgi:hypothetical protein